MSNIIIAPENTNLELSQTLSFAETDIDISDSDNDSDDEICIIDEIIDLNDNDLDEILGVNDNLDLEDFNISVDTNQMNTSSIIDKNDSLGEILNLISETKKSKPENNDNVKPSNKDSFFTPRTSGAHIMGIATSNSIANNPMLMEEEEEDIDYSELLTTITGTSPNVTVKTLNEENDIMSTLNDLINSDNNFDDKKDNNNNKNRGFCSPNQNSSRRKQSVVGSHRDSIADIFGNLSNDDSASDILDSILDFSDDYSGNLSPDNLNDDDALANLLAEVMNDTNLNQNRINTANSVRITNDNSNFQKRQINYADSVRIQREEVDKHIEQERQAAERIKKLREEEKRIASQIQQRQLQNEQRAELELKRKKQEIERKERELKEKIENKKRLLQIQIKKEQEEREREEQRKIKQEQEKIIQRRIQEEKERKQREQNEIIKKQEEQRKKQEQEIQNKQSLNEIESIVKYEEENEKKIKIDQNDLNTIKNELKIKYPFDVHENDIKIIELLGTGTFGSCHRSININTQKEIILKKINGNLQQDIFFIEKLRQETSKLCQLNHKNLINIQGIIVKKELSIITEYIQGKSLFTILRNREIKFDINDKIYLIKQIADGISFLHSNKIIFSGLKSKNIILKNNSKNIILRDFGFLCIKDELCKKNLIYIPQYSAPEILQNSLDINHYFTEDIYSFGILMWEIFECKLPYKDLLIIQSVIHGKKPDEPKNCPLVLWKIMQSCWHINPDHRPTIDKIISILNQPIDRILQYGFTSSSPPSSSLQMEQNSNSSEINQSTNDIHQNQPKISNFHLVIQQITQMLESNSSQMNEKALKVLLNIGRTKSNIEPIISSGIIPLIHKIVKNKDNPLQELSIRSLNILCEWENCKSIAISDGVISSLIINLSSFNELVVLLSIKLLICLVDDKNSKKLFMIHGGINPLLNILNSLNDSFVLQATRLFAQLVDDDSIQSDFFTCGGVRKLFSLLSCTNPGIQFHVLVALSNLATNTTLYPVIEKASIFKRLIALLQSKSKVQRLEVVSFFKYSIYNNNFLKSFILSII